MQQGGGTEKKRKGQEGMELDSTSLSLRSQASEINDLGTSCSDNCKDLDIVSIHPECSTSTMMQFSSGINHKSKLKDQALFGPRIRSVDDSSFDYDSGIDNFSVSSSVFEFQKAERAPQRVPLAPFSKPPSKWDDAQKWIASPTSNRSKNGQANQGIGSWKPTYYGYGSRQPLATVVAEVPERSLVPYEELVTKQVDPNHKNRNGEQKFVSWDSYSYASESYSKPVLMIESCIGESTINLSCHDSSLSIHNATTFIPPPSTARSVSMRDMGTEMTPIASQEPSRTGTPVRATTPTRSPTSSRPSTPERVVPASSRTELTNDSFGLNRQEMSDQELQMKTRREIMLLGTKLGKYNIAAWAGKDDEDKEATTSQITLTAEQPSQSVIETRAAAWEEAEKAKYMARFRREEIKIQAWENHQRAKTEAEMRKIEVKVERMRARAHDKLMNKIASVQHKAEEDRSTAESRRNTHAAKTEREAEYIRRTGRVPYSFSCYHWCF